jgi:hypothetical protein
MCVRNEQRGEGAWKTESSVVCGGKTRPRGGGVEAKCGSATQQCARLLFRRVTLRTQSSARVRDVACARRTRRTRHTSAGPRARAKRAAAALASRLQCRSTSRVSDGTCCAKVTSQSDEKFSSCTLVRHAMLRMHCANVEEVGAVVHRSAHGDKVRHARMHRLRVRRVMQLHARDVLHERAVCKRAYRIVRETHAMRFGQRAAPRAARARHARQRTHVAARDHETYDHVGQHATTTEKTTKK